MGAPRLEKAYELKSKPYPDEVREPTAAIAAASAAVSAAAMGGWLYYVYSLQMGASCTWLMTALTYRVLDLKINNFGYAIDDCRIQSINVGVQKSFVLGCKIDDFWGLK